MHPMKLKELPSVLRRAYLARVNVMCWSEPALGKTDSVNEFARQMAAKIEGFKLHHCYVPTMGPTDIQCAMPNMTTGLLDMYNNGTLPNAYKDPHACGIVFQDELPNGDPATVKLLQKYDNGEDMNGVLRKPDNIIVVGAGNRLQDKSGSIQQGRAFLSRFMHIDLYTDANDNTAYADKAQFHPYVQAFFKDNPRLINNYSAVFEPESQERKTMKPDEIALCTEEGKRGIWASMRGWKRISDMEYAADQLKSLLTVNEVAGSVGTGVSMQYDAHKSMIATLASIEDIIADPKKAKLPVKISEQYAQACILALKAPSSALAQVHVYGERLPMDMQAVILTKMIKRQDFKLTDSPVFTKWIDNDQLKNLITAK